ncbi:high-affinity branched-chain amino acid ABC transporter system permease protein LivH [Gottschalkia purinilytica]|uniref:High-affinity branched-chain amino acid ABC transporter system permease protein LivH n=1 Tax=Gottschalkia purinilytica TaxID=1503 RepID=A0A0L0W7J0_GOTPU|nr:branched-chain amino acid ABC transporter permease [Gottschalkia purinilytica]KNF07474.1 high-affinity branched-chain amino acid ABC transporter system permease protein LivH [Gottschalkia purinilytica]
MFLEHFSNGIALGSIYALTAIGFTMVYGIIRLINFAHGDIYMVGAFIALLGITALNLPIVPAFLLGMAGASIVGILIAKFAYSPVFKAPRINLFLSAIGMALFLENFAMLVWGPETQSFPNVIKNTVYVFGGLRVSKLQLIILGTTIVLVLILTYIVQYTKMGKAMRCVSQDMDASRLMGINTNRIVYFTFALGSSLGAAAGVLVGMYYKAVFPMMGFVPGLKAFIAAVIGGIGSIPGAMLGGIIMGVSESLGAAYISSGYRDAIAFIILIIILLFKPAGILGKSVREKV